MKLSAFSFLLLFCGIIYTFLGYLSLLIPCTRPYHRNSLVSIRSVLATTLPVRCRILINRSLCLCRRRRLVLFWFRGELLKCLAKSLFTRVKELGLETVNSGYCVTQPAQHQQILSLLCIFFIVCVSVLLGGIEKLLRDEFTFKINN